LLSSQHTSIFRRLLRPADDRDYLDAVAGPSLLGRVAISEASYIQLGIGPVDTCIRASAA